MNSVNFFYDAIECGDSTKVAEMLENVHLNPADYNNQAIRIASEKGNALIVRRLMEDSRVDPSNLNNYAICWAADGGHDEVVRLLLRDLRVDPSVCNQWPIRHAIDNFTFIERENVRASAYMLPGDGKKNRLAVIDRLYSDFRVYSTLERYQVMFTHLHMFRSRMLQVCFAMHSLNLPDLQTLKIIDQLMPNTVRRWAKVEFIRKVKHFRV